MLSGLSSCSRHRYPHRFSCPFTVAPSQDLHRMTRETRFTRQLGIDLPIICGAMYPCSNPELVAAASAAGAIGVVQPVSLTYVHGHDFRAGLRLIKSVTDRPFGMNALIEKSSRHYHERLVR